VTSGTAQGLGRAWAIWFVLCTAALPLFPVLFAAQQAPTFRSGTETVPLYVTVLGQDGRLVTDLTRDDFLVFDNARPQPVTLFDADVQPISIIVMLDMSGSMTGNIATLRQAAVQMFTRLLPADKARVGSFGDRINISPKFTNDQNDLIRTLYLDLEPGGPTPLWGAVNAAMTGLSRVEGRRVVLVISDGRDTGSVAFGSHTGVSLAEVTQRAQLEEFMVYAIGMRSRSSAPVPGTPPQMGGQPGYGPGSLPGYGQGGRFGSGFGGGSEPDPGLRELAFESGGGYFELVGTTDLGETFARVADELHRQYLIGYTAPDADGKLHQVAVRVRAPGMTVRARHTYLAPRKASR
jgi:Ca-activated chloride channel homolog